ncbi:hypothetical protein M378DRAFT_15576 [Amanita muscaria Koide BX008]|uniref:Uncharacterized protein n=1 Tax=Amanita muscaria (strain Koide BX008) TaxID=946122 RepID=A0A0C2WAV7_AMAMK|nr:hypothetical protein M378DRAFT_15576 [Amanita muscaria Koide BX008]
MTLPPFYNILVKMTKDQAKKLSEDGYSLCFAKAFSADIPGNSQPSPVSQVIAAHYKPGGYDSDRTFQWTDEFAMAANDKVYKPEDVIQNPKTKIYPVKFKDLLKVEAWDDVTIVPKAKVVDEDGFGFNPTTFDGVSILYYNSVTPLSTTSYGSPCYTSEHLVPPGLNNVEKLTPKPSADVFFSNVQASSVEAGAILYCVRLDFDPKKKKTSCTITLKLDTGTWDVKWDPIGSEKCAGAGEL